MQAVATSRLSVRAQALARWVRLIAGLWVFAAGLSLMLHANLGLSSWDVLHDALAAATPISFGHAVIAVSLAVVIGSLMLGVKPGPGTVANVGLIGLFTDMIVSSSVLDVLPTFTGVRVVTLVAGILAIGFGTALYIGAALGAGPRDSLMLAMAQRFRTSPGTARTAIELSVLVGGTALGGAVGVGTLLFTLGIGPVINLSFRILGMPTASRARSHVLTDVGQAFSTWLRRGRLSSTDPKERSRYTGGRI